MIGDSGQHPLPSTVLQSNAGGGRMDKLSMKVNFRNCGDLGWSFIFILALVFSVSFSLVMSLIRTSGQMRIPLISSLV